MLPVGTIISLWEAKIPNDWVACDGAKINVEGSEYNGLLAPNLNNDGRFLRGTTAPGGTQDSNIDLRGVEFSTTTGYGSGNTYTDNFLDEHNNEYFGDHDYSCTGHNIWSDDNAGGGDEMCCTATRDLPDVDVTVTIKDAVQYSETRPINMGVYFIMKVL